MERFKKKKNRMKRFFLLALTAGLLSSCSTYTPKDPKLLCANLADAFRVREINRGLLYSSPSKKYEDKYNEADLKLDDIMQELAIVRGEKRNKVIRIRKDLEKYDTNRDKWQKAFSSNLFNVLSGYGTFCRQYGIDLYKYQNYKRYKY